MHALKERRKERTYSAIASDIEVVADLLILPREPFLLKHILKHIKTDCSSQKVNPDYKFFILLKKHENVKIKNLKF